MKTEKDYLIKRIRGRLKAVDRTKKTYPYSKWITKTKHVISDIHGVWVLDTTHSIRYGNAKNKSIKELKSILKKI